MTDEQFKELSTKLDKIIYILSLPEKFKSNVPLTKEYGGHFEIPDCISAGLIKYNPIDGPDTYYQTGANGFSINFNPKTGKVENDEPITKGLNNDTKN